MGVFNIVMFIGFTALVAVLSYYWTKGTDEHHSEGYFLGGRSLTAPVIAGSLLLTNLSTEQIVGLTGQAYTEGILVMAWETLAAIAMVVTALVLVLGIGINYTLFFGNPRGTPMTSLLAVTLAMCTTLLTLGMLVFSSTQAISSFGIVLCAGIFIAFLLAPLALPDSKGKRK